MDLDDEQQKKHDPHYNNNRLVVATLVSSSQHSSRRRNEKKEKNRIVPQEHRTGRGTRVHSVELVHTEQITRGQQGSPSTKH